MDDDFFRFCLGALFYHDDVSAWLQGFVVDTLAGDAIDGHRFWIDIFWIQGVFFEAIHIDEGGVGNHSEGGVVVLVVDVVFDFHVIGGAPVVAHGGDVAGGVVVEVIHLASVSVAMEDVVAPFRFGAQVDVMLVDGGDPPEVAGDGVVAQDGFAVGGGAGWFRCCCR